MRVRITPKTLLDKFNHCSNLKRTVGKDSVAVKKEFDEFNVNYVFGLANSIKGNEDKLDSYATHFSRENTIKFDAFIASTREYSTENVKQKAA